MLFSAEKNKKAEEIKDFLPIQVGQSFAAVKPFIGQVENEFLRPLIGDAFYKELEAYYKTGDMGSGEDAEYWSELLAIVQRAVIHLAYWRGFAPLNVGMSDKGFLRNESATEKSLYKYQEEELKNYFKSTGHNSLDSALAFLERNIEYFGTFAETDTYLNLQADIVPNSSVFNKYYFIDSSRLVFLRMKPYMEQVADLYIRPTIGESIFDTIVEGLKAQEVDVKYSKLLPYLQKPIIYMAIWRGIEDLGVNITDRMVYFESEALTMAYSTINTLLKHEQLKHTAHRARQNGESYLNILQKYLQENIADFEGYNGIPEDVYRRDNTDKKSVWLM